jgi:hypothetical protein
MNDTPNVLLTTCKSYLRFIPIALIPLAGLLFLMTVAPYLAVNKGCGFYEKKQRGKRNELALTFAFLLGTIIAVLLIVIASMLAPSFLLRTMEVYLIVFIYGSVTLFSMLGTR